MIHLRASSLLLIHGINNYKNIFGFTKESTKVGEDSFEKAENSSSLVSVKR